MSWGPVVVVVLVVSLWAGADACSMPVGWRPPTVEEEILNAEVVLYGEVWRTFPDDSGRPTREHLYTAEVEVFCILKGSQSSHIVNITDVGFVPGMCDSTSLDVGNRYVILAHSVGRNDVYRASATMQAQWLELSNYTRACGLQKMYPICVYEESASWTCPTPAPPGECLSHEDFRPQEINVHLEELPTYPLKIKLPEN